MPQFYVLGTNGRDNRLVFHFTMAIIKCSKTQKRDEKQWACNCRKGNVVYEQDKNRVNEQKARGIDKEGAKDRDPHEAKTMSETIRL